MEIKRIASHKVSIYLDATDLEYLGITYESFDTLCPHSRCVIQQLLETALAQTGFDPQGHHLLIEAYPLEDGCLLFFSFSPTAEQGKARIRSSELTLCLFPNFEQIVIFCRQIPSATPSALYWHQGQYILELQQPPASAVCIAEDSELLLAELKEHRCCLLPEQAVDKIQRYFIQP